MMVFEYGWFLQWWRVLGISQVFVGRAMSQITLTTHNVSRHSGDFLSHLATYQLGHRGSRGIILFSVN